MQYFLQRLALVALAICSSFFLTACNPLENKSKAGLQVETGDIPATLFLNDQYLEKTPFINKGIKPGTYTLKIQPDNAKLATYETEVSLRKGLLTVVTWLPGSRAEQSGGVVYELEKISDQKNSELTIVSIPDAAILKVQGREKEFAPVTIGPLDPGEKEYEVSLPSYDTQKHTVNLLPGYRTTITIKLAKSALGLGLAKTATNSAETKKNIIASPAAQLSTKATASASASPLPTPKVLSTLPPTTSSPKIVIKPTNFFQDEQEVLRVRSTPNAAGETVGFALVKGEYSYQGKTESGWHQILFDGKVGWVSGQYTMLIQ